MFSRHFAPSKWKIPLHDLIGSKPNPVLAGEQLDEMGRLSDVGSCISTRDRISDEVYSRIRKALLVFGNLRHLRHRKDFGLSIKVGIVLRIQNMAADNRRYGNTFGVWTPLPWYYWETL